ncbi:MAG: dihydrofolate reductase [Nevskiaceae bacterium]|nr:MAG: dihydrofolate reductase [Nevskiaceae bacterium]TBR74160.1 MAG: dihydrofolate reductase [Nevskiaceae bacterium]
MNKPEIVLVVAVADNGVIGKDGVLPWHLPADLQHFKRVTMGHTLLMGRRTWESFHGPLPGRTSWVLTRDTGYTAEGVRVFHDFSAACAACTKPELHVIGGAQVFAIALPLADRLELTRVHATPDGDTHFPAFDATAWQETWREELAADTRHPYACTFLRLQRRR